MKAKRIAAVCAMVLLTPAYYIISFWAFDGEVREAFPELREQTVWGFVPWPFGPMWFSHVAPDHPLYILGHVEPNGDDGTFERGGIKVIVMAADGNVMATRQHHP